MSLRFFDLIDQTFSFDATSMDENQMKRLIMVFILLGNFLCNFSANILKILNDNNSLLRKERRCRNFRKAPENSGLSYGGRKSLF